MSYGLYIGKNLTADGIAYLAGYGDEPSSHWLEIEPRRHHGPGEMITVGVTPDGTVVLAISRSPVSLGAFARAFRDGFGCQDALFLDGGISAFAALGKPLIGGKDAAGSILSLSGK